MGWLILVGYVLGGLITAWFLTPHMADSVAGRYVDAPGTRDRVFAAVICLAIGVIWPLVALVMLVAKTSPTSRRERSAELNQREQRIASLERDLLRDDVRVVPQADGSFLEVFPDGYRRRVA